MKSCASQSATRRSPAIVYLSYLIYLFLFLEIASRITLSNEKFFYKYIFQGDYVSDAAWRLEWIRGKKKVGGPINLGHSYAEPHPLLGWKLKPNVKDLPEFNGKMINTNSHGIRSLQEIDYEKPTGKIRILILGESFTFGTEVGDEETYPAFLQKYLPQADVINFGVFGYGFDQMLLYLKEFGLKYHPDIVVIPFLETDKSRAMVGFRDYAKPYFTLKGEKLILKNTPIASPAKNYYSEFFRSKFVDLIRIFYRNSLVKSGAYFRQEEEINKAILHEIVDTARQAGATPIFAYLEGIRDPVKRREMSDKDKAFFDYWGSENVPSVYLLSYINSAQDAQIKAMGLEGKILLRKRTYGHFSPEENAIIAYGLKNFLMQYQFIK